MKPNRAIAQGDRERSGYRGDVKSFQRRRIPLLANGVSGLYFRRGKYTGKMLKDVPEDHLKWLLKNVRSLTRHERKAISRAISN